MVNHSQGIEGNGCKNCSQGDKSMTLCTKVFTRTYLIISGAGTTQI